MWPFLRWGGRGGGEEGIALLGKGNDKGSGCVRVGRERWGTLQVVGYPDVWGTPQRTTSLVFQQAINYRESQDCLAVGLTGKLPRGPWMALDVGLCGLGFAGGCE